MFMLLVEETKLTLKSALFKQRTVKKVDVEDETTCKSKVMFIAVITVSLNDMVLTMFSLYSW